MDIKTELEKAKVERLKLVNKLNELDAQKRALVEELLRIDGEFRVLTRLSGNGVE